MFTRPSRRFTLLDGMVLIAATALGFAAGRTYESLFRLRNVGRRATPPPPLSAWNLAILTAGCVALCWSLVLIALRLRRPRPRLRDLARQPGWVAGVTAAVSSAFTLAFIGPFLIRRMSGDWRSGVLTLVASLSAPNHLGPSVASAWAAFALCGRWHPEASWIDRLGRALGVFWIASALLLPWLSFWR